MDGRQRYRFIPWDMDRSWGIDALQDYNGWFAIPVIDRLANLNVSNAREKLQDVWNSMKERGFTYEVIEAYTTRYAEELNESGAFLRNADRWGTNESMADYSKILNYVSMRFPLLDDVLETMVEKKDEPMDFLMQDCRRGDPMVTPMISFAEE